MSKILKLIKQLRGTSSSHLIKPILTDAADNLEKFLKEKEEMLLKIKSQQDTIDTVNRSIEEMKTKHAEELMIIRSQYEVMKGTLMKQAEMPKTASEESIDMVNEEALRTIRNLECENFYIKQAVDKMIEEIRATRGCFDPQEDENPQ